MKTAFTATTLAVVLAAACAPAQAQFSKKQNDPQGAAAGASAKGAAANLEYCDEPMGTIAVVEEQEGDWYRYLTSDLRLPSTIPVIRMLIQQSNCFVVVERGRAMQNMMQERALQDSGELRGGSGFGKGQMVAADYTVNPSINFSQSNAGGIGGALGHFGGVLGAVGALAGGLKFGKAETMLTMIDNRSGVQIGVAMGAAKKTSFGIGVGGAGSNGFGALGGYSNTPEGKTIAAAFAEAYNNLVRAMRDYKPQQVQGGLGKGGKLKVGN
ncbi:CsgG/HfaB family protein [Thermomonas sp.]|uniref:CsgG/HfaB family protein n=1 Tax=Thermomonas sp. TaxID=1971895 RepID=UPI002F225435